MVVERGDRDRPQPGRAEPTPWQIPHEEHMVTRRSFRGLGELLEGDPRAQASFLSLQTVTETSEVSALPSMLSHVFSLLPRAPGERGFKGCFIFRQRGRQLCSQPPLLGAKPLFLSPLLAAVFCGCPAAPFAGGLDDA